MIVVDASAVVALLIDGGEVGRFIGTTIAASEIAYPSLMPYEVANALRRLSIDGTVHESVARQAVSDANTLRGLVLEFEELADRAWQLRRNLSIYDAAYVAVAESIDAPLLTLDTRIVAAPGTQCRFIDVPRID